MNQSEEQALKWLITNRNVKPDEVQFNGGNPSLTTKDGHKWAVKRIYGGKVALFRPWEFEAIVKDFANTTVLFCDGNDKPIKEIPARALKENSNGVSGIQFKYTERDIEGRPGEITLRLAQRSNTSRYRRISHVPMESLLAWPEGQYAIHKSSMNGKLDFFLVLSPE